MILHSTIIGTLLAALIAAAGPIQRPPTISGEATVIDGDTLTIGKVHIRLWGMDAPEIDQRCTDDKDRPFNCGELAADVLQEEIAGGVVVCFPVDVDRYKRIVAVCTAHDTDLGARMVERGFARDYEYFSGGKYAPAEQEARQAKRGLWAGEWANPREWRQEHRR